MTNIDEIINTAREFDNNLEMSAKDQMLYEIIKLRKENGQLKAKARRKETISRRVK